MKKISKRNFFLFLLFFPFVTQSSLLGKPVKPNLLVVWKKKRLLALYRNNKIIKSYRIRLGFNPKGHKLKEGDGKTPEGKYYITHKNPKSKFYLSLGINFPNKSDKKRAQKGQILAVIFLFMVLAISIIIHYLFDWTEGCIAVTNREIKEIYDLVDQGKFCIFMRNNPTMIESFHSATNLSCAILVITKP